MKKTILKIMILNVVLASSCWDAYYYTKVCLTETDKLVTPYKLGQTVSFIDSIGNSFVLKVIKDSLFCEWLWDGYHYERKEIYLQSDKNNTFFSFNLYAPEVFPYNNSFRININNFIFYLSYNSEGEFFTNNLNSIYFHASLEINNKIYYDVVECIKAEATNKEEKKEQECFPFRLLYNKMYGVLQLEDKEKTLFTINN